MSHVPTASSCEHVWGAWSTEERLMQVGEMDTIFVMVRRCYVCQLVQEGTDEIGR